MKKVVYILLLLSLAFIQVGYANDVIDDKGIKNKLLIEALDEYGYDDPIKTSMVWAKGLKERSGALQYSTLSKNLKKEYVLKLDEIAPNWVTRVSSPWVENYNLICMTKISDELYYIKIRIFTKTSAGPYENYDVMLKLIKEEEFFKIDEIKAPSHMEAYMY